MNEHNHIVKLGKLDIRRPEAPLKGKAANISPTDSRASKGSGKTKGLRKMRRKHIKTKPKWREGGRKRRGDKGRGGADEMLFLRATKGLVNEVVGEATPRKPRNKNTQNAKTRERKREQEKNFGCNVFWENSRVLRKWPDTTNGKKIRPKGPKLWEKSRKQWRPLRKRPKNAKGKIKKEWRHFDEPEKKTRCYDSSETRDSGAAWIGLSFAPTFRPNRPKLKKLLI